MKRILFGLAATAILLTSCQKKDVTESLKCDDGSLKYGVYTAKTMKTSELTNEYLTNTDGVEIPLYAYAGAMNAEKRLYFQDKLTYDKNKREWKTQNPRFLPMDGSPLQFFTFYPGDSVTYTPAETLASNVYPTFKYTILSVDKQEDLVATMIKNNTGQSVAIQLQHVLSQINFGIKGCSGAKISVSDIEVRNVYEKGTFKYNKFGEVMDPEPNTVDYWTVDPASLNDKYIYPFSQNNSFSTPGTSTTEEDDNVYVLGDGGNWSVKNTSGQTSVYYVLRDGSCVKSDDVSDSDKLGNSLILMPQKFIEDACVSFQYKVQDLDGNYVAGDSDTWVKGDFRLADAGTTEWRSNLRYLYILDFNLKANVLDFTVDVEELPWENYDWNGNTGEGTGILDIQLLGDIFTKHVKSLNVGETYTLPNDRTYHLFNDILWDWSTNTMKESFNTDEEFHVTFGDNVKFRGCTLTINAPRDFGIVDPEDDNKTISTINVTSPSKVTFRSTKLILLP